jgi:hypothetical protein
MSDGGKGSSPRPFSVGHDTFAKQFEAIFGKKHDTNKDSTSAQCTLAQREDKDKAEANPKDT